MSNIRTQRIFAVGQFGSRLLGQTVNKQRPRQGFFEFEDPYEVRIIFFKVLIAISRDKKLLIEWLTD